MRNIIKANKVNVDKSYSMTGKFKNVLKSDLYSALMHKAQSFTTNQSAVLKYRSLNLVVLQS